MAKTVDHHRLSPEELGRQLRDLGLSPWDFAALLGVGKNTVALWLLPETDPRAKEPPYWPTVALDLMRLPGAMDRVLRLHEENKVSNDGPDA